MPIFKLFLPKVISDLFMKNIFYDLCCTIPVFSCFVSSVRTNRVSCLANTKVSCKARVHNFKVIFSSQQYSIKEAKMKQMSLLHLKWSKLVCFITHYGYTSWGSIGGGRGAGGGLWNTGTHPIVCDRSRRRLERSLLCQTHRQSLGPRNGPGWPF